MVTMGIHKVVLEVFLTPSCSQPRDGRHKTSRESEALPVTLCGTGSREENCKLRPWRGQLWDLRAPFLSFWVNPGARSSHSQHWQSLRERAQSRSSAQPGCDACPHSSSGAGHTEVGVQD